MANSDAYAIVVIELSEADGGGYYGFVPDLPGCASDGETRSEAIKNTEDALAEWLYEQELRGVTVPVPGSSFEVAQEREEKLLGALQSLAEYRDSAKEKIGELERKLSELIAILRDEKGRVPSRYMSLTGRQSVKARRQH